MTSPESERPKVNIDEIYADFLKRFAAGEFLDIADLFAEHPQFESELRELHGQQETLAHTDLPKQISSQGSPPVVQVQAKRYAILQRIAQGGMGVIYKVYDTGLRRELAMKLIRDRRTRKLDEPGVITSPESVARFIREAEITATLDHPGIVPIHDMGTDEKGRVFFTMRLVHGNRLDEIFDLSRQKKEHWSIARALDAIVRICETLAFAHSRGVIHRDLKPANIMVGQFGETYVMDWGLAKVISKSQPGIGPEPEESAETTDGFMSTADFVAGQSNGNLETSAGSVVGTAAYMPPEQASGLITQIDARSDIFSVGAILYELLTAKRPYLELGKNAKPSDIVRAIRSGPPVAIRTLNPKVPGELAAICDKAMAREQSDRYQTMQDMADDLRAYLEDRVVRAYQTGAVAELRKWMVRNRGLAISSAIGLIVAVGGLLVAVGVQSAANAKLKTANEDVQRETRLKSWALIEKDKALVEKGTALKSEQAALQQANKELRRAEGLLLARASSEMAAANPALALRLALESNERCSGSAPNSAILAALPAHHEVRALFGHRRPIHAAALNRSGTRLVTASSDRTAIIWDLATGQPLSCLVGHNSYLHAVKFSPDGTRVATASFDRTAALWDAATGARIHEFAGHDQSVWDVAFSPDGKRVATGSADRTARIWDATTGTESLAIRDHSADVYQVAFSPDGSQLLTGSGDKTAGVWDAATGALRFRLEGHAGGVGVAKFSPDGKMVLTTAAKMWTGRQADGSESRNLLPTDHTVRVWDAIAGTLKQTLEHLDLVAAAEFNHDGSRILAGSKDGSVTIWNSETGQKLQQLELREGAITTVAFSPDGRLVAAGTERGPARLWVAATGQVQGSLGGHTAAVTMVGFISTTLLATTSVDHTARLWNAVPDGLIQLPLAEGTRVTTATISPDNARVVIYSLAAGQAVLGTFPDGRKIADWDHGKPVGPVQFSPSGRYVVTLINHRVAQVYTATDGRLLKEFDSTGNIIQALFRGDQRLVTVDHKNGIVTSWDLETLKPDSHLELPGVKYLRISPNGQYLLIWFGNSKDFELRTVGTTEKAKLLASIAKTSNDFPSHQFSDDARYLVTWTRENPTARIWETATGRLIAAADADQLSINDVKFAPDGSAFVTSVGQSSARIWNPVTGRLVTRLPSQETSSAVLFIGPRGARVVSRAANKLSHLWDGVTGRLLQLMAERDDFIEAAWFSRDEKSLVTLNAKKDKFSVWDPHSGERLASANSGSVPFTSGSMSRDGRWFVTGYSNGTARIWPVNPVEYLQSQNLRELTPNENDLFQVGVEKKRIAYRSTWNETSLIDCLCLLSKARINNPALLMSVRKNSEQAIQDFVDSLPAASTKADKAAILFRLEQVLRKRVEPSLAIQVALAVIYVQHEDFQNGERLLRSVFAQGDQSDQAVWDSFSAVSLGGFKRTPQEVLSDFPKSQCTAAEDLKWVMSQQEAGQPVRIRCGGGDYVSPSGEVWRHDCFFGGGQLFGETVGIASVSNATIKNTSDQQLYQTERWFDAERPTRERGYRIPLQAGRYHVVLHFAEIYFSARQERVFDVLAEDTLVISNYEPLACGFETADQRQFEIRVDDGLLDLEFRSVKNNPKISAIEIVRLGD